MGLDELKKKKKPHQLVSKRKDGKRPGYYGPDEGFGDYDDSPSSSGGGSDNGGGYDYEYVAYNPPAPAPAPDTSGDDQEEDVARMMIDMGLTPDNAPTVSTLPDAEDGGDNLYATPSQTIQINPVDEFGIKGSVYANTGFTPVSGPNVTYDTIANLPPPQPKGILQTIGGGLKTAAKVALPFVAPAFLPASLAKGYTTYNQARAISRLANLATKGRTGTLPTLREAFTKFQGTGNRVPNTATGYESDGDDRLVPKNVIAANVQKFSPKEINNLQSNIAFLGSVLEAREYGDRPLNNSQLSQISNQRDLLIEQYNMIQKMQADPPKTMVT
jgi:hypothetical protein